MDAEAGAESEDCEAAAKLPSAVRPEKEVSSLLSRPHALPGPRRRLSGAGAPADGDSPVLPAGAAPELAELDPEAGPAGWAVPVGPLGRVRAPPPGRCGAAKAALRALPCGGPELPFAVVQVKR